MKKFNSVPSLDLNPSIVEVQAAKEIFLRRLNHYAPFARQPEGTPGYMRPETDITCALAEVWRQGRIYQRDHDSAVLFELAGMEAKA